MMWIPKHIEVSLCCQETASSPLPLAVREVLSTAKGTTFFVLTVAGEHGIQNDNKVKSPTTEGEQYNMEAMVSRSPLSPVLFHSMLIYIERVFMVIISLLH